jgi:hypothetical protein
VARWVSSAAADEVDPGRERNSLLNTISTV